MPVLTVRGAGVRQRGGWLFRDLEVTVASGELVAVVGPPGSGRTTALLALVRRFKLSAGTVELSGPAALGYVPDVQDVEPVFTVGEHVKERLALLGRSGREAAGVALHGLDPSAKGRDLSPYSKQVLGLVLAGLSRPSVIAFDGVDAGLNAAEQEAIWRLAGEFAADGIAMITTARELADDLPVTQIRLAGERAETADEAETAEEAEEAETAEEAQEAEAGEEAETDAIEGVRR